MTTNENFEKLARGFFAMAEQNFMRAHHLTPLMLMIPKDPSAQMMAVPMPMKNQAQKDSMFAGVRELLKDVKPLCAFMVTEIWSVVQDKPEIEVMPRDHPDREEAIMIMGRWDGGGICLMKTIHRASTGIPYLDLEEKVFRDHDLKQHSHSRLFDGIFEEVNSGNA